MIDLNNIIQNMSAGTDASAIQGKEVANTLLDGQDEQNNSVEGIDPESFVLLMANMLSHIPVEKTAENEGTVSVSVDSDDRINERQDEGTKVAEDSSIIETLQNPAPPINNNAALVWIDADNFQPPELENKNPSDTMERRPQVSNNPLQQNKVPAELLTVKNTSPDMNLTRGTNPGSEISGNGVEDEFFGEQDIVEGLSTESGNELYEKLKKLTVENAVTLPKDEKKENENKPKADEMAVQNAQSAKTLHQQASLPVQQARQNTEPPLVKTLDIPVDIGNSQWADKFSEHIVWLGHQGIKSALIRINPEDLGPLEISIKVVKDSASVNIVSHSGHVRDVVDQALHRLREMMAEQGLNLSEAYVGLGDNSQGFSQQNNERQDALFQSRDEEIQLSPLSKKPPKGLIDFFA
ncbi:flagellar hook-length control protein FliK [Legionella shakespearei]|uniref:Putative flagellar hook-length control protein n=1 Tax=Legionella shakespearei DSM 23087 TaxID=1122169 RepID=A0A0W0YVF2_9GAMM|nr:flagellar hook-length control protein FliK [Legionella shakespearei]KTD60839.1 putative flagellar hook-length control protein [Legionella shakespearei DSM 23087]